MFAAALDEVSELAVQGSLFATGAAGVDRAFRGLARQWLDTGSWVDHAGGWLRGADEVMAQLVATVPWRRREVTMYGRRLREPRLTAWWVLSEPAEAPLPILAEACRVLTERYERAFDSLGANLYRDGRDSVAWHSDRIGRSLDEPVVAIISLGQPRPFLLRPRGGGRSHALFLGGGDLIALGGRVQHDWEHSVPKVGAAGPRLSLMFRHGAPEPGGIGEGKNGRAPPQNTTRTRSSPSAPNCHPAGTAPLHWQERLV